MKLKGLFILSTFALFTISCKKEKLEGETAILIGSWNWTHTIKVSNYCEPDTSWQYSIVDFSMDGNNYSIDFLEKGKVKYYVNDGLLWNDRIVFESKEQINVDPYQLKFTIKIDNKSTNLMEGMVGADTLMLYDYPKDTDTPCEEYFNYFIRG